MRSFLFFAALLAPLVSALSFNAYDLGFHGWYPTQHFHSVDFQPPATKITQWNDRCNSGNLFFTPRGPLVTGSARGPIITDAKGNLIWMNNRKYEQAMNFNVQKYNGTDYLTFWTKTKKTKKHKHSKKSYVMLDSSYKVAHTIKPIGKGLKADSHEFRITPQGTALIAIYKKHEADCTELGLGKSCWIQDGIFQEINIATGELIFEWRATDHISYKDVYSSPNSKDGHGKSKKDAFDFFHINSVDKTDTGDYIISARYMHAVVCISGKTGEVLWQLGGKNNRFKDLGGALNFAWQHHVTWQGNNTISLFDNHANTVLHSPSKHSKGMIIHLDMDKMTATLLGKYVHPDKILNVSQGSVQVVNETGNVLVGFGNSPTFVEYSPQGEVLCAAHFGPHVIFEIVDFGGAKSYRVFKHPWVGRPKTVPDVKVKGGKVYVSWNGATEVTGWRLERAGELETEDEEFVALQEAERDGFETSFKLGKSHGYIRVVALDAAKEVMAYSAVVKAPRPSSISFWKVLISLFGFGGVMGIVFWLRKFPRSGRLPRFPTFSDFKSIKLSAVSLPRYSNLRLPRLEFRAHSYRKVGSEEEYDSESDSLLLNERDH